MKGLLAGVIAIVILALVIPRPDDSDPPKESAKTARAATVSTSGSITRARTRDGMPVFRAADVGPGTLVEGQVSIANAGQASGYFSVSQKDLADRPGPGGGALSRKLRLEIRDVTNPSKPVRVYSGPFAGMGVSPAGFIAPDRDRDYQFTATLAGTEGPGSPISGEDSLRGSAASARFVWSVVAGAPKPRPARPAPPQDRRPPRLRVGIPGVQRLLTRASLQTKVRCSERCALTVTGTARASRTLRAGRLTQVPVRLPRAELRSLRRRLLAGRPVAVRLRFTATDAARNRVTVRRTVRLKPRRR